MAYNAVFAKRLRRGGLDNNITRKQAGEGTAATTKQKFKAYVHMGVPPKEAIKLASGTLSAGAKRKALRHAGVCEKDVAFLVTNTVV